VAQKNGWSAAKLREAIKAEQPVEALPPGKFDVIYADPPWKYDNSGLEGSAEKTYKSVMNLDAICALEVAKKRPKDGVLFCWATNPFLKDVFSVIDAWGYQYKTNICWAKGGRPTYGKLGFYVQGKHELLLIATCGSMLPSGELPLSLVEAPKGEHSRKPDAFYDIIEAMYPSGKYLELFARRRHSQKWEVWGNEV
jgi:N6-adenosine-specific RNA methylase IME4